MPYRVKSYFEIYKTNIDIFFVIMNVLLLSLLIARKLTFEYDQMRVLIVLIYQGSESEDVVCCAVIR